MKYPEKMALVKQGFEKLKEGFSYYDIRSYYKSEGLYPGQVTQLIFLLKTHLFAQLEKELKADLLQGSYDQSKAPFHKFDQEVLQEVIDKLIKRIKNDSKLLVNKLLKAGKSEKQVIEKVKNNFYNSLEIKAQIKHYDFHEKVPHGKERKQLIAISAILFLLGTLVGITWMNYENDALRLISGILIAAGIICFKRSYLSEAEMEGVKSYRR